MKLSYNKLLKSLDDVTIFRQKNFILKRKKVGPNDDSEISNVLQPSTFDQFNWPTTLNCPISDTRKKQEQETKKGPNLERVGVDWSFLNS